MYLLMITNDENAIAYEKWKSRLEIPMNFCPSYYYNSLLQTEDIIITQNTIHMHM